MRSTHKVRGAAGVTVVACVSVVGLLPGSASADPKNGAPLELSCEGGLEVDAVVFSNGQWSPALDAESNAVYHPVAFRDESFMVTDADGNVVFEGSDPARAKNGNRLGVDLIECEYSYSFVEVEPELGGEIFIEGSGIVTGFVTG